MKVVEAGSSRPLPDILKILIYRIIVLKLWSLEPDFPNYYRRTPESPHPVDANI
jgi:hypothetical protein